MNKPFSLRRIKKNSLAGFLQKEIRKQAQIDSWVEFSKTPNLPLSKYKIKKTDKNLLWWIAFSKNLLKQTLP